MGQLQGQEAKERLQREIELLKQEVDHKAAVWLLNSNEPVLCQVELARRNLGSRTELGPALEEERGKMSE